MRFVPMTANRGRSWGVYDMVLGVIRIPLYTFRDEARAEEVAEELNSKEQV